jgi:hypothetical protein
VVLLQTLRRFEFTGGICLTAMDARTAEMLEEYGGVRVIRPFKMAAQNIVSEMDLPVKAKPAPGSPLPDEPV